MNKHPTETRKHRNGDDITAEYYYGMKPDNCRFLAPGEVIQKGDSAYSCGHSKYIDCAASIGRTVEPTDDKIYIRCEGDTGWRLLGEAETVRATDEYRYGKDRLGDWEWVPAKDRIGCPAGPACVYRRATPEATEPAQTEAAHTPGPWHVSQPSDATLDVSTERDGIRSRIARLHCECLADEHGGSVAANARLIAAAPDLLALLPRVLDFEQRISVSDLDGGPQLIADIHAAIAKATGGAK